MTETPLVTMIRTARFSAAHRYWNPDWDEERNRAAFGASTRLHGHDYTLAASVTGPVDPVTGMVFNITELKDILEEEVHGRLDHVHLEVDVPELAGAIPTSEVLAGHLWRWIDRRVERETGGVHRLTRIELSATADAAVELVADYTSERESTMMMHLTSRYRFCASHRLDSPALSADENRTAYGKCNNPNGHGHNYELEVTLAGDPDPETGMVVDVAVLDEIVEREIVERYDHKHLNVDVPDFRELVPTAENILVVVWDRLADEVPAGRLHRLRLLETADSIFEYHGPGPCPPGPDPAD